jgi:hypothetical protein
VLTDGAMTVTWDDALLEFASQMVFGRADDDPDGTAEDGDPLDPVADEDACPARYETAVTVILTGDDGAMDQVFAVTLEATAAGDHVFEPALPLAHITSTATPPWDPADWENNEVRLYASFEEDADDKGRYGSHAAA